MFVKGKWTFFSFNMPWCYQVCITKCFYCYWQDLPKYLFKITAEKRKKCPLLVDVCRSNSLLPCPGVMILKSSKFTWIGLIGQMGYTQHLPSNKWDINGVGWGKGRDPGKLCATSSSSRKWVVKVSRNLYSLVNKQIKNIVANLECSNIFLIFFVSFSR